jgi:hypothetical protein
MYLFPGIGISLMQDFCENKKAAVRSTAAGKAKKKGRISLVGKLELQRGTVGSRL